MKRNKREYEICKSIATYLRLQFPDIIFHFDLAGLNLSRAQAGMMKSIQGGRGFPDLIIYRRKGNHLALCLEVKKEETKIYLKDGVTVVSDEHIREQVVMLKKLNSEGYCALFGIGLDKCIAIINFYLKS